MASISVLYRVDYEYPKQRMDLCLYTSELVTWRVQSIRHAQIVSSKQIVCEGMRANSAGRKARTSSRYQTNLARTFTVCLP
jgi:hypothetical protein